MAIQSLLLNVLAPGWRAGGFGGVLAQASDDPPPSAPIDWAFVGGIGVLIVVGSLVVGLAPRAWRAIRKPSKHKRRGRSSSRSSAIAPLGDESRRQSRSRRHRGGSHGPPIAPLTGRRVDPSPPPPAGPEGVENSDPGPSAPPVG